MFPGKIFSLQRILKCGIIFISLISLHVNSLELGGASLLHYQAHNISIPAARSGVFFRAIGGVAFNGIATARKQEKIIDLNYDATKPDGERLSAMVKDQLGKTNDVIIPAFDWEFIPIARFVQGGGTSAVTLFGNLENKEIEREARAKGYMIINYDENLKDTLIGIRLLQGDMLVFVPSATDLFKETGKYILGNGESAPIPEQVEANQKKFNNVSSWITKKGKGKQLHQSYVVGDLEENNSPVQFETIENKLILSGKPKWYCWKSDPNIKNEILEKHLKKLDLKSYVFIKTHLLESDLEDVRLDFLDNHIISEAKKIKLTGDAFYEILKNNPKKLAALMKKVETNKSYLNMKEKIYLTNVRLLATKALSDSTPPNFPFKKSELEAMLQNSTNTNSAEIIKEFKEWNSDMDEKRIDNINKQYGILQESVSKEMEKAPVIEMKKYSNELTSTIEKNDGINPVIYHSLVTSMQLSAFFRNIQKENPRALKKIVTKTIKHTDGIAQPQGFRLKSPTIFPKTI